MKRLPPPDSRDRFSTSLRHYHRSNTNTQRSWDDWVNGAGGKPAGSKKPILKIVAIVLAVLALGGIAAGLIIEMR